MHSLVVLHSLRVKLLQDCLVLGKQCTFLLLDNSSYTLFLQLLCSKLLNLVFALLLVDSQFFLPKSLDLSFMFKFTHASSLGIHLLKTFVFCKFFHKLALKFIFHPFLLSCSFSL